MLVLTRKHGDRVVIDGGIRITVVELGNGRVRIGFTAPDEVNIWREEIADEECRAFAAQFDNPEKVPA